MPNVNAIFMELQQLLTLPYARLSIYRPVRPDSRHDRSDVNEEREPPWRD